MAAAQPSRLYSAAEVCDLLDNSELHRQESESDIEIEASIFYYQSPWAICGVFSLRNQDFNGVNLAYNGSLGSGLFIRLCSAVWQSTLAIDLFLLYLQYIYYNIIRVYGSDSRSVIVDNRAVIVYCELCASANVYITDTFCRRLSL